MAIKISTQNNTIIFTETVSGVDYPYTQSSIDARYSDTEVWFEHLFGEPNLFPFLTDNGYKPERFLFADVQDYKGNALNTRAAVQSYLSDKMGVLTVDQTTRSLDLFFGRLDDLTTLSVQADPEDTTLTLTDATGFVDGTTVGVFSADDPDVFYLGTQIGAAAGNVITLDTPIDQELQVNSAVAGSTTNMAVDGSVTNQIFQIGPVGVGSTQTVDVTRIMGHILDATAMDDSKFGGIAALTNGCVLRKNDGVIQNLWNVKTNSNIILISDASNYSDKAAGGEFGFNFQNTYGGDENHGVVIELKPTEYLELLIQDDLTDLIDFRMMAQGHFRD